MYFWHIVFGLLLVKTLGDLWAMLRAPRIAEPATIDDVMPFLERGEPAAAVFWYQQLYRTGRTAAEGMIDALARDPGLKGDLPLPPWIGRCPRRNGLAVIGAELVFLSLALGLQFGNHIKEPPVVLMVVALAAALVLAADRVAAHRSYLRLRRVRWAADDVGVDTQRSEPTSFLSRLVDAWRGMRWLFFGYFTFVLATFGVTGRVGSVLVWGFAVGLLTLVLAGVFHSRVDRLLGPDGSLRDNLFSVFVLCLLGAVLVVVATHGP